MKILKTQKTIAIVGAYPYNGNRGVGALSFSTLYILNEISKEHKIKFNIILINPEYGDKKTDVFKIGKESIKVSNFYPISIFSFRSILKLTIDPKQWRTCKIYNKINYVLDMGAGDSFSDIYGINRFKIINDQHRLASFFGKKLLLLPQTIGPFSNEKVLKQAKTSIEKSNVVMVRDKMSYEYVKNISTQQNLIELIDVAFFMPFTKKQFSNEKINVGLNISALLFHGGYTQNNQFGLALNYPETMRQIIDYFINQENILLHLVPHVVSGSYSIENDYAVSRQIMDEYNSHRIVLAPFFLDPIDAKNYISGLDFFTGARMHACIAAFSSGVPVFPLAYSRKFNGLFEDTLQYSYMGDMINQTSDDILKNVRNAFEKRDELKTNIQLSLKNIVSPRYSVLIEKLSEFLDI
jgi:colanic acid/amylovoran biosynthesis protein